VKRYLLSGRNKIYHLYNTVSMTRIISLRSLVRWKSPRFWMRGGGGHPALDFLTGITLYAKKCFVKEQPLIYLGSAWL